MANPMQVVDALRIVIAHHVGESLSGTKYRETKQDLRRKGLLNFNDFQTIYSQRSDFSHTAEANMAVS